MSRSTHHGSGVAGRLAPTTGTPDASGEAPPGRWPMLVEGVAVAAILAVFAWAVWSVIVVPAPLAYDEAVYAAHARHVLEATPDTTWRPHRAPGLPALGMLVHQVADSERAFRLVGLLFAMTGLVAVWWFARTLARSQPVPSRSAWSLPAAVGGLVAAGVYAVAPPIIESAGRFLTDLPAAALLVLAAVVLWREFELRAAPTWGLLPAAPLLALAFSLRFGSALFIALLLVVSVFLWWGKIRRRLAPVVATAAVLAVLLVPHMVNATTEFGAPWGRLLHTSWVVSVEMERSGPGLPEYREELPFDLAGPVTGPATVVAAAWGGAALLAAAVRRRWSVQERAWVFLLVPAVAHIVLIGLRAHADVRFLFPGLVFLCVAAGVVSSGVVGRLGRRDGAPAGGTTATVALGSAAVAVAALLALAADAVVATRASYARKFQTVQAAAWAIADRSEGDCFVVTSYAAQVLWYSGCATARFQRLDPGDLTEPQIVVGDERFEADARWIALFDRGIRQPEGDELAAYLSVTSGRPDIQVEGKRRMAWGDVYRVRQPDASEGEESS